MAELTDLLTLLDVTKNPQLTGITDFVTQEANRATTEADRAQTIADDVNLVLGDISTILTSINGE